MKKISFIFCTVLTVLLASCGSTPHEHTFEEQWSKNETSHWHAASCEHTELTKDLASHTYGSDGKCTVCGKAAPVPAHVHTFSTTYSFDETNHWRTATCEHKEQTKDLGEHTYGVDNKCTVCGMEKPIPPHEHTFSSDWTIDEVNHWHAATCEHTELTKDLASHTYGSDGKCTVCGKAAPVPAHVHTFSSDWTHDETNHWHAATCEHTDLTSGFGEHAYNESGKCTVCGYQKPTQELLGYKATYIGEFSDVTYIDCTEDEFIDAMRYMYNDGWPQLRKAVFNELTRYKDPSMDYPPVTPDGKIWFGDKDTAMERTLEDGSKITTYKLNNVEGDLMLFEYGLDPTVEDHKVYHFYETDYTNITYQAPIIATYTVGHPTSTTIMDEGFTMENGVISMKLDVTIVVDRVGTFEAKFTMKFGDENSPKLVNFTKQPQDVTVNYPKGYSFEVEVDKPEEVLSYKWYSGGSLSFGPLYGNVTNGPRLDVISSSEGNDTLYYKCLVTGKNFEYFSDIGVAKIANSDEYLPIAYILDYPIRAGEILDLADTPYGSGTIEYKANGEDFVFTNVHFNNENIDLALTGIGFTLESWHNPHDTFNFEFIGDNVWHNAYWEEDNHQGGFGFFFHFAGDSKIPTVNFKGDGTLTIIGGTRAISGNVFLNVYNNISILGLPYRVTKGIVTVGLTVKKDASITGSLGGEIIFIENDPDRFIYGDLVLEEGSRVNAIINPGKVSVGGTEVYGVFAAGDVTIDKADLSLEIYPDYEYFVSTDQPIRVQGLGSMYGKLTITESRVGVNVKALKVPSDNIALFIDGVNGVKAQYLDIIDSSVIVGIDTKCAISVRGIFSGSPEIKNSRVYVDVKGCYDVSGIVGYAGEGLPGNVDISNSQVRVNVYAAEILSKKNPYYIDAGIRGSSLNFGFDDNSYIVIYTNEASPLVATYETGKDNVTPTSGYVPKYIILDDFNVVSDPYEINLTSYKVLKGEKGEDVYIVKCETMYLPNDYTGHITSLILDNK